MIELHELKSGLRVRGLMAVGAVTVVAVEPHGDGIVNVVLPALVPKSDPVHELASDEESAE